jgi:hypothetical protein
MVDDLLDIERLRKLWEPRPEERPPVVHRALAGADTPPEPRQDPRELLARMEALALSRFPAQRTTLLAFFQEARGLMEGAPPEPGAPPVDNRAALGTTLNHLEELLEALSLALTAR